MAETSARIIPLCSSEKLALPTPACVPSFSTRNSTEPPFAARRLRQHLPSPCRPWVHQGARAQHLPKRPTRASCPVWQCSIKFNRSTLHGFDQIFSANDIGTSLFGFFRLSSRAKTATRCARLFRSATRPRHAPFDPRARVNT